MESHTSFIVTDIYGRRFYAKAEGVYSSFEKAILSSKFILIKKESKTYSIDDKRCLAKVYIGRDNYFSLRRMNLQAALVLGREEIKETSTFYNFKYAKIL